MNDLIEEVMEEQQDLEFKIYKLSGYLDTAPEISKTQLDLLTVQKQIMLEYNNILLARIKDLMGDVK